MKLGQSLKDREEILPILLFFAYPVFIFWGIALCLFTAELQYMHLSADAFISSIHLSGYPSQVVSRGILGHLCLSCTSPSRKTWCLSWSSMEGKCRNGHSPPSKGGFSKCSQHEKHLIGSSPKESLHIAHGCWASIPYINIPFIITMCCAFTECWRLSLVRGILQTDYD